uniref:Uncharacterized protein n=1 Tax=Ascaris lumbricoides TaxID=6252 RepID=A0A0M3IWU6_ASCLU
MKFRFRKEHNCQANENNSFVGFYGNRIDQFQIFYIQ